MFYCGKALWLGRENKTEKSRNFLMYIFLQPFGCFINTYFSQYLYNYKEFIYTFFVQMNIKFNEVCFHIYLYYLEKNIIFRYPNFVEIFKKFTVITSVLNLDTYVIENFFRHLSVLILKLKHYRYLI